MLKSFCAIYWKYLLLLPGSLTGLFGLIQSAEKLGYNKSSPKNYDKLVNLYNGLLDLAIDQWLGYMLLMAVFALLWAFVVAEPKAVSKRKFSGRAKKLGGRSGK